MGLERLACVMQGVDNLFEVDTIRKVLDTVSEISGKKYGADYKNDVSIRVITDHIRTATFLIYDGVLPSNEGRGYILRRVLRRAARHGRLLGINGSFLPTLCDIVINENLSAYPGLEEKREYIKKIIKIEEERFDLTIDSGLDILSTLIADTKKSGGEMLSGEEIFRLYDTFGFPVDLTREIAAEAGLTLDEDKFTSLMQEQRERARNNRKLGLGWEGTSKFHIKDFDKTEFTGYTEGKSDAKVTFIFTDEEAESVSEGEFTMILDRTPFYGEGGGQVGDTGRIYSSTGSALVIDTKKDSGVYMHICRMESGVLSVGDAVTAEIDSPRREAIRRNHSSVHLLQAALRAVLGSHVEQSGSYVDEKRGRFDFSHFAPLTSEEISRVETLVNSYILAGYDVVTEVTDVETAKAAGAMALFGEKYGSSVRMVSMGGVSRELCGGTHVSNTSKIGLFKIIYEGSVAAGVRRIESVTGEGVLSLIAEKDALIESTAHELKSANVNDIAKRAASLQEELRRAKHELEAANAKLAALKAGEYIKDAKEIGGTGIKLIAKAAEGMDLAAARELSDKVKAEHPDMIAVFAVNFGGKLNFVVSCGADAVSRGAHAGKIAMKVAAVTGGKGGGRPDSAVAGGADSSKVSDALDAAAGIVGEFIH